MFVGIAESRVELGRAGCVRDGTQDFAGPSSVTFFVIQVGQRGHGLLRIGLQLDRGLELVFGLLQIVVQPVETSQQKVIVHIVGFDLDDLFVLLDGQLENVLRALSRLRIAQRAQINAAQQFMRFQVVRVTLENVLRLEDGIPNAARLGVETAGPHRIGVDRQPILLNGFIGQLAATVHRHLFLVHVSHGVVVIGRSLVQLAGRRRGGRFGIRSRNLLRGNCRDDQQQDKNAVNTFHREPSASQNHSDWMPDRCWWVLF